MANCTLDPEKQCDLCGECDDYCPTFHKLCDNCFQCLEVTENFAKIDIEKIILPSEQSAETDPPQL